MARVLAGRAVEGGHAVEVIVVLAVPVVARYGDALAGKVVVDVSNTFVGADDTMLVTPRGRFRRAGDRGSPSRRARTW